MIPDRAELLAEINQLTAKKKLREKEIETFLEHVKGIRKEIENLDAQIKSQWAVYNKFYKKQD